MRNSICLKVNSILLVDAILYLSQTSCSFVLVLITVIPLHKQRPLAQVFSCEFCEVSKNTFFHRTPLVAASNISGKTTTCLLLTKPIYSLLQYESNKIRNEFSCRNIVFMFPKLQQ